MVLVVSAFFVMSAHAQLGPGEEQPKLLSASKPIYPKEARDAGIGGEITVRVMLSEKGEVLSVDEPTGLGKICDGSSNDPRLVAMRNSMIEAVRQSKFSPGTQDGKPQKTTFWMTNTFDPTEDDGGEKKLVKVGTITKKALRMPKPEYPGAARAVRASGPVPVRVVVDEKGDVFTAAAIGGHPLLRSAAVAVACDAKFSTTEIDGKAVRITGIITYNFVPGR